MDKRIKVFLVILLAFVIIGYIQPLLAQYGFSDALFPALPIIGTLPIVGAILFFLLWHFWLRKQVD